MTRIELFNLIIEYFDEEIENGKDNGTNYPVNYNACRIKLANDLNKFIKFNL